MLHASPLNISPTLFSLFTLTTSVALIPSAPFPDSHFRGLPLHGAGSASGQDGALGQVDAAASGINPGIAEAAAPEARPLISPEQLLQELEASQRCPPPQSLDPEDQAILDDLGLGQLDGVLHNSALMRPCVFCIWVVCVSLAKRLA